MNTFIKALLLNCFFFGTCSFLHAQPAAELTSTVNNIVKNYPLPPQSNRLLFYLQRNKNSNTVVYEANLLPNGKPDPENPVHAYWIRYTEGNVIKELTWMQRWLAYGMDAAPANDGSGNYILTPVALKHRKIILSVDKEGKASAHLIMNGKYARMQRIYAHAIETKWLPTVKFVQITGEEVKTKQRIYEYVYP